MKKILASLFFMYLLVPASFGQDDGVLKKALGVSFILNDFKTANAIRTTSLNAVIRDKKWSKLSQMKPGVAITYFKGIKKYIDFAGTIAGSFVNYPMPAKTFVDEKFLLEGNASLYLKMTSEAYWVQPYISIGVGGHKYRNYWGAYMPLGLGMRINFWDEGYFFVNSTYRAPVTTETANYHFQNSVGIAGALGKKKEVKLIPPPPPPPADTDGDGITDDKDKCPTVKGVAKYDGCPVPDSDKDGINDDEDKCPTVPGVARYQGCPIPDSDKDGINDEEDKCPTVPGVARYQGCPVPDRDKDGVNDEDDKCPDLAGTVANQGCPELTEEVKKTVAYAAKNIYFLTGSTKLQSKSFKGLNDLAAVMVKNPDMKLDIDGHTDNVGSDALNQKLSDGRTAAVKAYLVSKGVAADKLTATGHGETTPVADNKTAAGRALNRRVELKLHYY